MSFTAIKAVYELREKMSPKAKSVLVALAYHQNKDTGQCNPSMDLLKLECSMSKRSIIRGLDELVKNGLVTKVKIGGLTKGANCYGLTPKTMMNKNEASPSVDIKNKTDAVSINDIEDAFEGVEE